VCRTRSRRLTRKRQLKAAAAVGLLAGGLLLGQAVVALGVPRPPAPKVSGAATAPPPAWIETARGDRWLAFSSFCWKTTCVDFIPPAMRPELPRIALRRGETVRFHLAFRPTSLRLLVGNRAFKLAARRVVAWRVSGGGLAVLEARAAQGSTSYAARLSAR